MNISSCKKVLLTSVIATTFCISASAMAGTLHVIYNCHYGMLVTFDHNSHGKPTVFTKRWRKKGKHHRDYNVELHGKWRYDLSALGLIGGKFVHAGETIKVDTTYLGRLPDGCKIKFLSR